MYMYLYLYMYESQNSNVGHLNKTNYNAFIHQFEK